MMWAIRSAGISWIGAQRSSTTDTCMRTWLRAGVHDFAGAGGRCATPAMDAIVHLAGILTGRDYLRENRRSLDSVAGREGLSTANGRAIIGGCPTITP